MGSQAGEQQVERDQPARRHVATHDHPAAERQHHQVDQFDRDPRHAMAEVAEHVVAQRCGDDALVVHIEPLRREHVQAEHAQHDLVREILLQVRGEATDRSLCRIAFARGQRREEARADQRQRQQGDAGEREAPVAPQQQPERDHDAAGCRRHVTEGPERRLDAAGIAGDARDQVAMRRRAQPGQGQALGVFEQPRPHLARHRCAQLRLEILVQQRSATGDDGRHQQQHQDQYDQPAIGLQQRVIDERAERLALAQLQPELQRHQQPDRRELSSMRAQQRRETAPQAAGPAEACNLLRGGRRRAVGHG